jgi:hypothetical protein
VRYEIAVGKIKGKRSFSRPRCRCNNNNKMNRKCEDMDWISLAEGSIECSALVNTAIMNLGVHKDAEFHDQLNQYQLINKESDQ